jgi:dCMP deaminase
MTTDSDFLGWARGNSIFSNDPSTKTGAALVKGGHIIGDGYNSFACGVAEDQRIHDRELKLKMIIHCEINAILSAALRGNSLLGATLFTWPFMSCARCAAVVIQAGIRRCVAPYSTNPRWQEDFAFATSMFHEAGVALDLIHIPELA